MECPRCRNQNRPDSKFCQRCGQPLVAVEATPPPAQISCVRCGMPLRSNTRFCARCGAAQSSSTPQPQPQPQLPAYRPGPAPAPINPPPSQPSLPSRQRSKRYLLRHSLTMGVLAIGLAVALIATLVSGQDTPGTPATPPPVPVVDQPTPLPTPTPDYRQAVVEIGYEASGLFGLRASEGDPATPSDDGKLLTFDATGRTNNTRIWIDGDTPIYGDAGFLGLGEGDFKKSPDLEAGRVTSIWSLNDIDVTQLVSYVYGTTTGRVDTLQIRYDLTNRSSRVREVGLRLMLDTLIGDNDGVPFVVPGQQGITTSAIDLRGRAVPDFIQALERPSLANPGVIVNMTLRGAGATPPDRLVISAWCSELAGWDDYASLGGDGHPLARCGQAGDTPDSEVSLFFDPQPLAPDETRTLITYYGLGGISSTESGNVALSLIFNRSVKQDETFWVSALVQSPKEAQTVDLTLPAGLAFASGYTPSQPVQSGDEYTQVSWLVVANDPITDGEITATLQPDGIGETQTITIQPRSIVR